MNDLNTQEQGKNENKSNKSKFNLSITSLRDLFLPLFILAFLISTYFYFSEAFGGSISTIYIIQSKFSIHFGVTLLVFVFLSFLAGPYLAFFGGFLGELLYQLAYYNTIYIEWCLIVGILGILSGIYKYKPLKYSNGITVYYSFLIILITSTIISSLIILFKFVLAAPISLKSVLIDYGFKFFFEAFLSIIFTVPLLLLTYDRVLAKNEKHIYELFLTHHPIYQMDHTFYLKFGRTYIYFCSRCSGVFIGAFITGFFLDFIDKAFEIILPPEFAVLLCIILPIPSVIDWGTQSYGLRTSNTQIRLFTGFFLGAALYLLSYSRKYYLLMLFLIVFYLILVSILMFLGRSRNSEEEEDYDEMTLEQDDLYEE